MHGSRDPRRWKIRTEHVVPADDADSGRDFGLQPPDSVILTPNQLIEITAMEPLKKEAMDTLANLPDDADIDEIMYRLYVLDKIRKGREAVEQGRTISHEDLRREIAQW